jgi:hypothetical protein
VDTQRFTSFFLSFPFLFRRIVYRGTWQCSAERKPAPREGVKMHRSVIIHLTSPKDLAISLTIDDDQLYSHRSIERRHLLPLWCEQQH